MTEWRQCAEFPDYEISEDGVVRRLTDSHCAPRGKVLRPKTDRYGYLAVRPFFRGCGRHVTVHRLVAKAFLGEPPTPAHQVAHFDGNHQHNHYTNLRWATNSENTEDKRRHGRMPIGERHHKAKITSADVLVIRRRCAAGERQKDVGRDFGLGQASVSSIVRHRAWAHLPASKVDGQ